MMAICCCCCGKSRGKVADNEEGNEPLLTEAKAEAVRGETLSDRRLSLQRQKSIGDVSINVDDDSLSDLSGGIPELDTNHQRGGRASIGDTLISPDLLVNQQSLRNLTGIPTDSETTSTGKKTSRQRRITQHKRVSFEEE